VSPIQPGRYAVACMAFYEQGFGVPSHYASPDSSYDAPSTSWDMATISKMGPTIGVGPAKAQGSKAKSASRVKAA
jgi:hypothetical protein